MSRMASTKTPAVTAGTPYQIDNNTPILFRPLKIRSISLRNRICVSPMCLYSTESSGGNCYEAELNVFDGGEKHTAIASRVKSALLAANYPLLVGTVGLITQAKQARDLVQGGPTGGAGVDIVSIGRQFLKEPNWVLKAADELGVDIAWPLQLQRLIPAGGARI